MSYDLIFKFKFYRNAVVDVEQIIKIILSVFPIKFTKSPEYIVVYYDEKFCKDFHINSEKYLFERINEVKNLGLIREVGFGCRLLGRHFDIDITKYKLGDNINSNVFLSSVSKAWIKAPIEEKKQFNNMLRVLEKRLKPEIKSLDNDIAKYMLDKVDKNGFIIKQR
ncbi:MAG: hypothetical protein HY362_02335 [Candidatus Aenigmarchaeota archaeon]|nr:hypothetical protein [Candidatus Aenigmarchaeota archaeon]